MEGTVDSTSGDEWGFKDKQGENDVTKKDCGDVTKSKNNEINEVPCE